MNKRNRYSGVFKARVAIEALKGEKTLVELSSKYQIHFMPKADPSDKPDYELEIEIDT